MSCELSLQILRPLQVEKLTTRWPDCNHDTAAQFQELASRKWEQTHPGMEDLLFLTQGRWHWLDHWWSKWLSELIVLFLHGAPPCVYKSSCPWLGVWSQHLDKHSPHPTASIQNKANFPSHQPGLLTGAQSDLGSVTVSQISPIFYSPR